MRKSKEETAESRRRILDAAARLYREKGFDGVGVADIMEAAGMTHGGFYRHFPSKEALIGEAMSEAFIDRAARLAPNDGEDGRDLVRRYVETYLSQGHRDTPELGCPVAAVGSEAAHIGGQVSRVFDEGIERLVDRVALALGGQDEQRAQALRLLSTLVGAVVVARAVGAQSAIRDEVLDAVRADGEVAPLIGST
jgi:TetR/AcrR family transcriptional regulator, transcriptional repressor for nem operon